MVQSRKLLRILTGLVITLIILIGCSRGKPAALNTKDQDTLLSKVKNPFIPGYFGDVSLIKYQGSYYLFSTVDPWGSFELAVWESTDFRTWTLRRISWPTILSCRSLSSDRGMVSSPSVVQGKDGRFYMYVTVGGETWAGASDHPLGPWYSLLPHKTPLITNVPGSKIRSANAECFIDDDGQAWLFWGSGVNWQYGGCMAAKLGEDMCSFVDKPTEITPPGYFEAPYVMRSGNKYFMFYSDGRCNDSSYKVRYALADQLPGPWKEGPESPVLISSQEQGRIGPGHPSVLKEGDNLYLLYQAIIESEGNSLLRQVYLAGLRINAEGSVAISTGDETIFPLAENQGHPSAKYRVLEASSQLSDKYPASAVLDYHFGTLWVAAEDDRAPYLVIDLDSKQRIRSVNLWVEYGFEVYQYLIEYSKDAVHWHEFANAFDSQERGSPRFHNNYVRARYLRITFSREGFAKRRPALWEVTVE